jgi:tetratricopeptide (TPR) repeat protein
MKGSP